MEKKGKGTGGERKKRGGRRREKGIGLKGREGTPLDFYLD